MDFIKWWTLLFILIVNGSYSQESSSFRCVALGVKGGGFENNLTSFLIQGDRSKKMICLDAGSLLSSIDHAYNKGSFGFLNINIKSDTLPVGQILYNHISSYLISHGHFDHISGLIIASPLDNNKKIFASSPTFRSLHEDVFNWSSWANFTDRGTSPYINRYKTVVMDFHKFYKDEDSGLEIKAYPLTHVKGYSSTAFLIKNGGDYILYFGDTGSDKIQEVDNLSKVWEEVAPLVQSKKLKAVFLECSFPNERADHLLFGHLTPKLFLSELSKLADYSTDKDALPLEGLKVVITHIKPSLITKDGITNKSKIIRQLKDGNNLGCKLIFPERGECLVL
ncbi:MAG: MBL fold metallo-hydrolase [Hyphomicrobiales bacterium]